jgi:hypothetical protein
MRGKTDRHRVSHGIHVYMNTYTHKYMHTYTYVYVCMYTYVYIQYNIICNFELGVAKILGCGYSYSNGYGYGYG